MFLLFILILPIFGKGIDYQESLIFYLVPILFTINFILDPPKHGSLPPSKPQLIVLSLYLLSVIFSKSIGTSYYMMINFITVLFIFNLSMVYIVSEKKIISGITIASLIYSLVTITQKFFLPNLFSKEFSDNVFVQNWGHSYIADFLILSVPLIIREIKPKKIAPNLLLLFIVSTAITITNSRSSIVALIIGILLIIPQNKIQIFFKRFMVIIMALSLGYIFFFSNFLKSLNGSRPEYWNQALSGFISSPIVGIGPGNFGIINKLYREDITSSSNYAHNSILESLSGSGILFTVFVFYLVFTGLRYQYQHNRLFFTLGLMSLINSLLDPSWSSPGILVITLIIIFWKIDYKHPSTKLIKIYSFIILLFFISKTTSDILYLSSDYELSLKFDPFNPNSLSKLVDTKQPQIRLLYGSDPNFVNLLANVKYLPQNEADFYKSIKLDPKGSTYQITQLISFYSKKDDFNKLQKIIPMAYSLINPVSTPSRTTLEISKSMYKLALYEWHQNNHELAITHFRQAAIYSSHWSHFEIELATALWHSNLPDDAQKQLTDCQQNYPSSSLHCREFELEKNKNGWPQPGFLIDAINSLSST